MLVPYVIDLIEISSFLSTVVYIKDDVDIFAPSRAKCSVKVFDNHKHANRKHNSH